MTNISLNAFVDEMEKISGQTQSRPGHPATRAQRFKKWVKAHGKVALQTGAGAGLGTGAAMLADRFVEPATRHWSHKAMGAGVGAAAVGGYIAAHHLSKQREKALRNA